MQKKNRVHKSFFQHIIEITGILLLVFLIRTIGFGLYQVPSGSMETTMLVGERFFADKFSYWLRAPRVGEVIAFNDPYFKFSENTAQRLLQQYVWGPVNVTKRIVAGPGDTIEGKIEDGKPVIYVNNTKIEEPYVNTYPLIQVWKGDPKALKAQINEMRKKMKEEIVQSGLYSKTDTSINEFNLDLALIQAAKQRVMAQHSGLKSYNPSVSYEKQPFYRLSPERIIIDEDDKPLLVHPGTPHVADVDATDATVASQSSRVWNGTDIFNVALAQDEYWMMGDNRQNSKDSRWFGPIKQNQIHGKIVLRIWSVDSEESWWIVDLIKHPVDFFKRVRWKRFFQMIH